MVFEIQNVETNAEDKPVTDVIMESVTIEEYDGSDLKWYISDYSGEDAEDAESTEETSEESAETEENTENTEIEENTENTEEITEAETVAE